MFASMSACMRVMMCFVMVSMSMVIVMRGSFAVVPAAQVWGAHFRMLVLVMAIMSVWRVIHTSAHRQESITTCE
jgi:hypothetical protein